MKPMNILIVNNSHISKDDMSGGEKIAMELFRRLAEKTEIFLYTSNIGSHIWNKYKIDNIKKVEIMRLKDNSTFFSYFRRAALGALELVRVRLDPTYKNIIYSASDFWPDSIPAFVMKLSKKNVSWIAGFYLFAPKAWQKDSPYRGKRWFVGIFYFLTQLPVYWIVKRYADMVFVTSEPDGEKFVTKRRRRDKILVIRGGVDTKPSGEYLRSGRMIRVEERKYDACFVGRFHYQKGVLELVNIWRLVCNNIPAAKLAMVGIGPLEREVREEIGKLGLCNNVELLGFKDGEEKYEVFKQSKIVVHPAIYDSGGMAACEAMAWGLPGVSFDLEALRTYYQKGMLKAHCFDAVDYAENIVRLLKDRELYENTSRDAADWAGEWDWEKRAGYVFDSLERLALCAKSSRVFDINRVKDVS